MGLHLSRFIGMIYDTFENRRFERLLKPVKAVIVYLQCMFEDSHYYFFAMRLKSGGYGSPHSKKRGKRGVRVPPVGYAYPPYPYPPKVTPMLLNLPSTGNTA